MLTSSTNFVEIYVVGEERVNTGKKWINMGYLSSYPSIFSTKQPGWTLGGAPKQVLGMLVHIVIPQMATQVLTRVNTEVPTEVSPMVAYPLGSPATQP